MKDETKKSEQKLNTSDSGDEAKTGREKIEPLDKKETTEEKAKREGWTDTAQSHLGIDE